MEVTQIMPSKFRLSSASYRKLEGVQLPLLRVVELAIKKTAVDFAVIEGLRTPKRQKELFAAGATKTLNSRHLTGHAVDLAAYVGGKLSWDWPLYHQIAAAMKEAAKELGVKIVWGGDWETFPDGPHFELDRKEYP